MSDAPATDTTKADTNVVSRVDDLRKEAIASRDAVRQQLTSLRAKRNTIAAEIKSMVAEEEKLARIVRNLERMSQDGDATTSPE